MSVPISMTIRELEVMVKLIEMQRSAFLEADEGVPREEILFTGEDLEIAEKLLHRVRALGKEILPP